MVLEPVGAFFSELIRSLFQHMPGGDDVRQGTVDKAKAFIENQLRVGATRRSKKWWNFERWNPFKVWSNYKEWRVRRNAEVVKNALAAANTGIYAPSDGNGDGDSGSKPSNQQSILSRVASKVLVLRSSNTSSLHRPLNHPRHPQLLLSAIHTPPLLQPLHQLLLPISGGSAEEREALRHRHCRYSIPLRGRLHSLGRLVSVHA